MSKSEKDYQKEIDKLRKQEQQRERERQRERQRERENQLRLERDLERERKDWQKRLEKDRQDWQQRSRKRDHELNDQLKRQEQQHKDQLKRQQEQAEERARKREKEWEDSQQKRAEEQAQKNKQKSYIDDVVAEKNKKRAQEKAAANAEENLSMTGVVRDKTQQGKRNMSSNNIKKNSKKVKPKDSLDDLELDSTEDEDEKETLWEKIVDLDMKKAGLWVGAATLAVLLIGGMGYVVGASSSSNKADKPEIADSVEGSYGILEDVESMKDAQIRSLRSDLSSIKEDNSDRLTADEVTAIERMNMDTANTLDPFFDSVLRISRNATAGEITSHQNKLSEYMTDSASTSVLYEFLSGKTPARDLGEDTRKSGSTMTFWVSTTPGGSLTYLAVVPFVAESGTAKATYTVTVDSNKGKIDNINYNGILNDGDAQFVEESLAAHKEQAEKSKNANDTKQSRGAAGNNNRQDNNDSGSNNGGGDSNSGSNNDEDNSATTGGDQSTRRDINHGKAFCYDKGSELGPGNDVFC